MTYIHCFVSLFSFAPVFINEDGRSRCLGCTSVNDLPKTLMAHCVQNDVHHIRLFGNHLMTSQIREETETLFETNYANHTIEIEVN